MARRPIRVLVVDDSPFVRKAFTRVLADAPDVKVVGEAGDGREALAEVERLSPDVVLLDLGMPVLDGLATLRELKRRSPGTAVVVVSAATQKGASATFEALESGALDFVDKAAVTAMRLHELGGELLQKIRAVRSPAPRPAPVAPAVHSPGLYAPPEVLVVGASTGGPAALRELVHGLTAGFPAPVVVVQHIPASFLAPLAERLGDGAPMPVRIALPGEPLQANCVYLPESGRNAELERRRGALVLVRKNAPPGEPHVPSIEALFRSAAAVCGERAWGVLLTGMGEDGAGGLRAIRQTGGLTVAQDEATSAVFGMPRAAIELGAAAAVLPIGSIARFLGDAAVASSAPVFTTGPTQRASKGAQP